MKYDKKRHILRLAHLCYSKSYLTQGRALRNAMVLCGNNSTARRLSTTSYAGQASSVVSLVRSQPGGISGSDRLSCVAFLLPRSGNEHGIAELYLFTHTLLWSSTLPIIE